eukprot:807209-Pyramimonas_sp.AAC.2
MLISWDMLEEHIGSNDVHECCEHVADTYEAKGHHQGYFVRAEDDDEYDETHTNRAPPARVRNG